MLPLPWQCNAARHLRASAGCTTQTGSMQRRPYGSGVALGPPPSLSTSSNTQTLTSLSSSSVRERKPPVPSSFASPLKLIQAQAQAHLLSAIAQERAKRWLEAIGCYRKLLSCLSKKRFPANYVPGTDYIQLVFESYYHMGVAFQKLDNHHSAVEKFTNAIQTANIPKSTCQVGCVSSSIYQTPVYARRAYAYVKCDKIKEAICDATNAVHSDPSNPDVYCIRALVWSSAKEKRRALVDLNVSFKLKPSHICTLILRGAVLNSLGDISSAQNKDHEKACKLFWDSKNFFDVEDFYNPKMPTFYDKFLWSLNAFHTITEINLFDGATVTSKLLLTHTPKPANRAPRKPFKCGTPMVYSNETVLLRRKLYAVEHMESVPGIHEVVISVKKRTNSLAGSEDYGSESCQKI